MKQWSAAEAKANLSDLVEDANTEPQVITRHGKPISVVIDYQTFMEKRSSLSGGMEAWVCELDKIKYGEDEMDTPQRENRPVPDFEE